MMHHGRLLRGLAAIVLAGSVGVAAIGSHAMTTQAAPASPHLEITGMGIGAQGLLAQIDVSSLTVGATVSGSGHMHITMTDSKGVSSFLYNGEFTIEKLAAVSGMKIVPGKAVIQNGAADLAAPYVQDDNAVVKFTKSGDATLQLISSTAHRQYDFPLKLATPLSQSALDYIAAASPNGVLFVPMQAAFVPSGVTI